MKKHILLAFLAMIMAVTMPGTAEAKGGRHFRHHHHHRHHRHHHHHHHHHHSFVK